MEINLPFLISAFQIVLIDLVLSGDNAVIIAMVTMKLDPFSRKKAIFWGATGAIVLRICFTSLVAISLDKVILIKFIGGLLLIWITIKLLLEADGYKDFNSPESFHKAVQTIILADFVMSLDNVLGVGGASRGNLTLLVFGLMLSMPLLICGSQFIAGLINKVPWLIYVGAGVLAWVAGGMLFENQLASLYLGEMLQIFLPVLMVVVVLLGTGFYKYLRLRRL